jgi:thiamine-phosphate pyrophosphorylase
LPFPFNFLDIVRRQVTRKELFRVVDANYNRAKEGLRVCEDIARFVFDDKALTARLKRVRHGLTQAIQAFGFKEIIVARDIVKDVGRATSKSERDRSSVGDLLFANSQRVKESLRVLEEFAKLESIQAAEKLKRLRYAVYAIEKEALGRL